MINTKDYLLYSIISMFFMPFTGIVALSYAISAKYAHKKGEFNDMNNYINLCYKWLRITVITFSITFFILIILFLLLPELYK